MVRFLESLIQEVQVIFLRGIEGLSSLFSGVRDSFNALHVARVWLPCTICAYEEPFQVSKAEFVDCYLQSQLFPKSLLID